MGNPRMLNQPLNGYFAIDCENPRFTSTPITYGLLKPSPSPGTPNVTIISQRVSTFSSNQRRVEQSRKLIKIHKSTFPKPK